MEIKDIFSLGELFEKVQIENIFADGKTFVDCTPLSDLSYIHDRYNITKNNENFDLSQFVYENFALPENPSTNYASVAGMTVAEHIEKLWDVLTRQPADSNNSLIRLLFSYIVPGGRFREIYYWDSYFTMLGLQVSKRIGLIENMADNFSYLIDQFGYIPNGNRTYYLGRSQPPFFACMIKLLSEEKDKNILVKYLPQLKKEYDFWMKGSTLADSQNYTLHRVTLLRDGSFLNHYWDESDSPRPEAFKQEVELAKDSSDKKTMYRHLRAAAESGWDFSSRWFKNPADFSSIHTTDIVPVDLNCLLLNLEITIAEACQLSGDQLSSEKFKSLAADRKKAIDRYCWNEEKAFYFDYDYIENAQTNCFTLAAAFPLFFGIASEQQAAGVANLLKGKFIYNGGLVTTIETTHQQWDAPNGWPPLHWITIQGLAKYRYTELAADITTRWMDLNKRVYQNTGKMMEKYNVISTNLEAGGGEYPAQDGFGWTNGVYLALEKWRNQL